MHVHSHFRLQEAAQFSLPSFMPALSVMNVGS
jgi:hypothetical protein